MDIIKNYFTENECYKVGKRMKPIGIMVHSTGANNPTLKRYCHNDDDNIIGVNKYGNHWNQYRPDGRQVCVHGFIGLNNNGVVDVVQTLPWDMRGWHAGGTANDGYIGFEICEDNLKDKNYFNSVFNAAAMLCVYLCREYNINPSNIICHSEGRAKGIASNHADVMHWFPLHGESMDSFRDCVLNIMENHPPSETNPPVKQDKKPLYRVRKVWSDAKTQIGAYENLDYAIAFCQASNPYSVYDENGKEVYPNS